MYPHMVGLGGRPVLEDGSIPLTSEGLDGVDVSRRRGSSGVDYSVEDPYFRTSKAGLRPMFVRYERGLGRFRFFTGSEKVRMERQVEEGDGLGRKRGKGSFLNLGLL